MPSRITCALAILLMACHSTPDEPEALLVPEVVQFDDSLPGAADLVVNPTALRVRTYDGSDEMVHPDALVFPTAWHGSRFWYVATPYPRGNAGFENPSGYAGASADDWNALPGVANPLALPVSSAYLSDPDVSFDPVRGELRVYYRQTTADEDDVFLLTSHTGSDWSVPQFVARDVKFGLISPAVARTPDGVWRMWTVNASNGGCKARATGVALTQRRSRDGRKWGDTQPVALVVPHHVPWHWDVQYIGARKEYWALVAAFPDGTNCSRSAVFFAHSTDGTTWTTSPTPLLEPGTFAPMRDLVYRSTFRYFPGSDAITVWFSGAREEEGSFHYSLATARYPRAEFMRRVETPSADGPSRNVTPIGARHHGETDAARAAFIDAFP
ncbi:hypothetical protein BH11GEM1_BH11GEM1_35240 [soil metagenome]